MKAMSDLKCEKLKNHITWEENHEIREINKRKAF